MRAWQWVINAVVAVVAVLIGAALGPLLLWHGGPGYLGVMGPYGRGMMGGFGFVPFGWIGILLMGAFPFGLLVLVLLGIVLLVRAVSRPTSQPVIAPARICPNCKRPAQADWRNCPYCGTALQ
jgi:hypothetical protein